jgi:Cd2+/Zn2+-exporting ATPase/Cu+-exporting ATPase
MQKDNKRCGHEACSCCCTAQVSSAGDQVFSWPDLIRIIVTAVSIALVWLKVWEPLESISLLGVAATLICGFPIYRQAFFQIKAKRMTMELSMTIALLAALAISEVFSALVIVFFVLLAQEIEKHTLARGRRSIKRLLQTLPSTANVFRAGTIEPLPVDKLSAGDIVIVRPGAAVPVDGKVLAGSSFVNEAAITGEALAVEKLPGSLVYAGTINQSGALQVETTRVGPDTAYGKIIATVEEAERARASIQKTSDRMAGQLVYFALICAAFTFLVTGDLRATISVILVTGACGLAAGTPLAILGAIGSAAQSGTIIKGGLYLEQLGTVDTVVFDKTGTLTTGSPRVTSVLPEAPATADELLSAAATAELVSEHPLGKAIVRRAKDLSLPVVSPTAFNYLPGRGIVCNAGSDEITIGSRKFFAERGLTLTDPEVNHVSQVFVAKNGAVLGQIQVADTIRPEAKQAIAALKSLGIKPILMTGDSHAIAEAVAGQLGIEQYAAALRPDDKRQQIAALTASGKRVAMVGDGINDAPALMEALVGVAVGSGTDVARESADAVLIGNDLLKLVEAIKIARKCRRVIIANFVGTLVVDGLGVVLAACGLLNPLFAAFIHVTSESVFILNSARLLPAFSRKKAKPAHERAKSHRHEH